MLCMMLRSIATLYLCPLSYGPSQVLNLSDCSYLSCSVLVASPRGSQAFFRLLRRSRARGRAACSAHRRSTRRRCWRVLPHGSLPAPKILLTHGLREGEQPARSLCGSSTIAQASDACCNSIRRTTMAPVATVYCYGARGGPKNTNNKL